MNKVTETAPKRIWIQISDEPEDCEESFQEPSEDMTWCQDSVLACEVEYVRADDFEQWWRDIGSGIAPRSDEDQEDHAKRVALAAWSRQINEK